MRATVMHGAGDVRVETVPNPVRQRPTDAIVRVLRSAICGSDLAPNGFLPASSLGRRMSHESLVSRGCRRGGVQAEARRGRRGAVRVIRRDLRVLP
jgi:threonine dehydrogenase-like Zn-dependent dehydrogenase